MGWACAQVMRVTAGGPGVLAAGAGVWLETEPETTPRIEHERKQASVHEKRGPGARAP